MQPPVHVSTKVQCASDKAHLALAKRPKTFVRTRPVEQCIPAQITCTDSLTLWATAESTTQKPLDSGEFAQTFFRIEAFWVSWADTPG